MSVQNRSQLFHSGQANGKKKKGGRRSTGIAVAQRYWMLPTLLSLRLNYTGVVTLCYRLPASERQVDTRHVIPGETLAKLSTAKSNPTSHNEQVVIFMATIPLVEVTALDMTSFPGTSSIPAWACGSRATRPL